MKDKVWGIVQLVCGAVLAIGVSTVFAACGPKDDGTWMHCHDAQMALLGIGVAVAVVGLVSLVAKGDTAKAVLGGAGAVLGIAACLVPGTIVSMCMMDTMRCHAVMKPFAMIMGVLIAIAGVIALVTAVRSRSAGKPKMSV